MRRDGVIVISAFALAAAYLYGTYLIPRLRVGDPLGPKIFPILLGCGLLVGAMMLLAEMRSARTRPDSAAALPSAPGWRSYAPLAGTLLWTLLYFLLFEALGYLLATGLYLLVLMSILHRGHPLTNTLTAVLFTLGSYVAFTQVLDVRLARGILGF
jgi:putative tricarboxylic transport membrane protein